MATEPEYKTLIKVVSASSKRPMFGGQSEMEKLIEKLTNEEWVLVERQEIRKNIWNLQFEKEIEIVRKKNNTLNIILLIFICSAITFIANLPILKQSPKASTVEVVPPTQVEIFNQSSSISTLPVIEVNMTLITDTPILTETPLPTHTRTLIPTSTQTPIVGSVNGDGINSRSCPARTCEIVDVIKSTDNFIILGEINGWYLVMLENDKLAYILNTLVQVPEGAVIAVAPTLSATSTPRSIIRPTKIPVSVTPNQEDNSSEVTMTQLEQDAANFMFRELNSTPIIGNGDFVEVLVAKQISGNNFSAVIITYVTFETESEAIVTDVLYAFETIGVNLGWVENPYDFTNVTLVLADNSGNLLQVISVTSQDLGDYTYSEISTSEFINRWTLLNN